MVRGIKDVRTKFRLKTSYTSGYYVIIKFIVSLLVLIYMVCFLSCLELDFAFAQFFKPLDLDSSMVNIFLRFSHFRINPFYYLNCG